MHVGREPGLADVTLDRLAREWFADARTRQQEELQAARRSASKPEPSTGDADSGLLDWLFGGDDAGDNGACDGGDSGD